MRWLGVEQGQYDEARVQVSNNGVTWTPVWSNPNNEDVEDTQWTECVYDISSIADGQPQVYVRWVMGPTDGSVTFRLEHRRHSFLRVQPEEGKARVKENRKGKGKSTPVTRTLLPPRLPWCTARKTGSTIQRLGRIYA